MRLVISSRTANRFPASPSNCSAHRCASVSALISWVSTRSWLSDDRTLPSSTYRTPSSRPICFVSTGLLPWTNAVLREITNRSEMRDRWLVTSSAIASPKYCFSRSSPRLTNGSTTIERRGAIAAGGDCLDGAPPRSPLIENPPERRDLDRQIGVLDDRPPPHGRHDLLFGDEPAGPFD